MSFELHKKKREIAKRAADDEEIATCERQKKEVEEQQEIRKVEYEAELLNAEVDLHRGDPESMVFEISRKRHEQRKVISCRIPRYLKRT